MFSFVCLKEKIIEVLALIGKLFGKQVNIVKVNNTEFNNLKCYYLKHGYCFRMNGHSN